MFTRLQPGVFNKRAQPAVATLCTAKAGRNQIILTNLTAGTNFYICMGTGADDGAAGVGGTFDFILEAGKPAVVLDNYSGIVTCDPAPTAGQINVSELFGSRYRATRS